MGQRRSLVNGLLVAAVLATVLAAVLGASAWWPATWVMRPAQAPAGLHEAPPAVVLQRRAEGLPLTGRIGFLPDPAGALTLQGAQQAAADGRFVYPPAVFHSALRPGPQWLRVEVQASSDLEAQAAEWLLAIPSVAAREIAFHGPFDAHGRLLALPVVTGADHAYATRPLGSERMAFPFRLPQPGNYTLYLRVESDLQQVYRLALWNSADYLLATQDKRMFDGLSYGILLGMLVYNLVLLLVFRERVYAHYLLNCTFALLTIGSFNGHVMRYLLPDLPVAGYAVYLAAPAFWLISAAQFGRHFLGLRRHAPWVHHLSTVLEAVVGLALVAGLAGAIPVLAYTVEVGTFAGAVLMVVGGLLACRAGYPPALIYLAGLSMLIAAAVALILSNWGVLPWAGRWLNLLQVGVSAELVVFSVALGSRIRLLRRTQQELHARASHLASQAETDPLTGVANRAGLARRAGLQLASGRPMALMLLDLDSFKPINDRFGHAAGDRMLVEVARRLSAQVREGDTVARLGGDEFVVVLAGQGDREVLSSLAHRIVEQVRAPVDFEGHPLVVTSSVGIARYPLDAGDLDGLLRAADAAMYHCKHQRHMDFAFPDDAALSATPAAR